MNKILAVDVDLTVVDTAEAWFNWLVDKTGHIPRTDHLVEWPYDLAKLFVGHIPPGCDPMDFWRSDNLYDDLLPIIGSTSTLSRLAQEGWDIIFVSALKGNHHKSKHNFLKRFFPFKKAFIATKEKGYVSCDVLIDDRNRFLNMMPPSVGLIQWKTKFDQDEPLSPWALQAEEWEHIYKILRAY